ncbi:MAG TPA: HAMP domain-containing sensor histidine kinase [Candidatus Eremiobacteraceae bacterium]|nr:HAMP domain-containing sensor histidine kinase [Candidatus Eremiobacteraceae bacterium]
MNPIINRMTRLLCAFFVLWVLIAGTISAFMLNHAVAASRMDTAVLTSTASDIVRSAIDLRLQGVDEKQILTKLAPQLQRPLVSITLFDDASRRIAGDAVPQALVPGNQMFMRGSVNVQEVQKGRSIGGPPHGFPPGMPVQGGTVRGFFMSGPPMMDTGPPFPFGPIDSATVHIPGGFAVIRLTESQTADLLRNYLIEMGALVLIGILAAWFGLSRMVRRELGPTISVENALVRWSAGDHARLELVDADKSGRSVVDAYNTAVDQVASALKRQTEAETNMRQFVAEAGHELRTPLTVILGFLDVLRQGAVKEYALAQRILESMTIEGERMRALIGKLLLLARLDAVAPERSESVDVAAIVREVVDSFRSIAGQSKLEFSSSGDAHAQAAPNELRELIGNLLDNAIKYAPGATTKAEVRRVNGSVEVEVVDDGPGMDYALRSRAFDRFSRGEDRGNIPGSGLGLAIVKRIVDRAGGEVVLDTAPGRGVRVLIKLPITPA